jgi:hypothetical protein
MNLRCVHELFGAAVFRLFQRHGMEDPIMPKRPPIAAVQVIAQHKATACGRPTSNLRSDRSSRTRNNIRLSAAL